jgi:hypothetical protein
MQSGSIQAGSWLRTLLLCTCLLDMQPLKVKSCAQEGLLRRRQEQQVMATSGRHCANVGMRLPVYRYEV